MIEGISNCSLDSTFYEHWVYGKWNQEKLTSSSTTTRGIIELMHSGVWTYTDSMFGGISILFLIYK